MDIMKNIKVRVAPSLGDLEGTFQDAWDLETYNPETDKDEPCVFVGLYGLPDFYALWRHKGKKWIFWCGSDIRHFVNGYWLDDVGRIKLNPVNLVEWINTYCESWVENKVEQEQLLFTGVESKICPSFAGNVDDFKLCYTTNNKCQLYTSVSGDDFELYGWPEIYKIAQNHPNIDFHFYGNTVHVVPPSDNCFVHGQVPKEQMNKEIELMSGAIRMVKMEGFSEIIAKSLLMGQWPVSLIPYPHTFSPDEIGRVPVQDKMNIEGREWVLNSLNQFPWVKQ